jgi:transglutaminase-like putative cysteine protease
MIKLRAKKKPIKAETSKLQLNGKMYFLLLIFQALNLLTLVMQLHVVYIIFAVAMLLIQFSVHLKLKRKLIGASTHSLGAAQSFSTAAGNSFETTKRIKSTRSVFSASFYSAPKIIPSWLILLCAIGGSISLAISGRELGLLMSMVHLLCFAYSLKIFEIPKRKDLYQLVLLGMFIAISSLIFIQSIYFSIAVIILIFANLIVLMNFFSTSSALKQQSKILAKLVVFSIPLAILLFIGFPKLAPLWQVPSVKSAKVGLSDRVKIGDIAKLALSDELAFRVTFNDEIPEHSKQYWRAMVLDDFDGSTWQQAKAATSALSNQRFRNSKSTQINVDIQGPSISYQVITEPSYQSWLFALDFATSQQLNIAQRADFALYYRGIVNQTLSYNVTSYPEAVLAKSLSSTQHQLNLAMPSNSNPRLRAKGQQLRRQFNDDGQLINHVLTEFNQQQYFYTLQPPQLNGNTLEQFYFDTKAGFCEHYASTFTYLMRAAGIPARMVVGYLGSEINPKGNYLSVYQRNAHAWSEVWLAGQGWVRVDPTAAVDPERVDSGFSSSLMQEVSDLSGGFFSMSSIKAMWLYNQFKQQLDALDYQWTRWVIGYTDSRQTQVMKSILSALRSLENIFYFSATVLLLVFLVIFAKSILVTKTKQSKWQTQYLTLLSILAKQELVKDKSMTAMQFAQAVGQQRPEISKRFTELSGYYCQLEYQQPLENQAEIIAKLSLCYRTLRWQLWRANFVVR